MVEKIITKSFERLLDKGKHRGFITYEELGKSLGKRNGTQENLEKAFIILVDDKITLVEKKSQYQSNKKKETTTSTEEKTSDKSDDPIRMYLREMGGVELLSREGEIAIAKRIEAGKDVMINALTQSPIVGKKISEWKDKIENQEMLVRDIIDIDSTYEDFESSNDDEIKDKKDNNKKIKGIIEKAKKGKPYRGNIVNDLCQMGRSGYGSICAQGMQCTEPYDPGQLLSALPPGGSLQAAFRRPQNWPHPDSRSLLRTVAFPGARPLHRIPFQ